MLLSAPKIVQSFLLFTSLAWALVASSNNAVRVPEHPVPASQPTPTDDADIAVSYLPDGRLRYNFYHVGVLQLYVEENEGPGVSTYDPNGDKVSLEDYEDRNKLIKRVSKWQFLIKFAKLLAKFGKRALQFFECTGINAAWKCSDDFLDCATTGTPPWLCLEGLACIGTSAYECR